MNASELIQVLRKKLRLRKEDSFIIFANGIYLVPPTSTIDELYERYRSEDGFLYFLYTEQEAFGDTFY
jgi:GABA(A) receptor-associated protein